MSKRGENIYKRKDGRWEGRVKKTDTCFGKQAYKYFYGQTYKEVKEKMLSYRAQQNKKNDSVKYIGSIGNLAEEWLEEGRKSWKQSTYTTYLSIFENYIKPYFEQYSTKELNVTLYQQIWKNMQSDKAISNHFLLYVIGVVQRIIRYGNKKYNIHVEIPEKTGKKCSCTSINLPLNSTIESLEKYLLQHVEEEACLATLMCMYTGIRIGELCALRWENIDLENGVIYICENLQRVKDTSSQGHKTRIVIQTPKSVKSIRYIPIIPKLEEILQKQQKEKNKYLIAGNKYPWMDPRTMQYKFNKILKSCNIAPFNFHMLRHIFATTCLINNFDIKSVSEILGHSSVQITMNLYEHPTLQHKIYLMKQFKGYEELNQKSVLNL